MQTHLDSPMTRFAVIAVTLAAALVAPAHAQRQSSYSQPLPMYAAHNGGTICRTLECFGREAILKQVADGTLATPVQLNTKHDCAELNYIDWQRVPCLYERDE